MISYTQFYNWAKQNNWREIDHERRTGHVSNTTFIDCWAMSPSGELWKISVDENDEIVSLMKVEVH